MRQSLAGKVVFVTGAARGIGAHTARVAAARGAKVALAGLEPSLLAPLADSLGGAWFECDVTDQAALSQAVAGTVERFGGIDAVVANAGIAPRGTVVVGDIESNVRTIEVNLIGVMRTVDATIPHVLARRGYYLLVSSAAAFTALPGMSAYCASKAGVEQYGNVMRLELAHRGVAVGTAHMSFVDTDMTRSAQADLPSFGEMLPKLPKPIGGFTPVEACARAFVDGIERRKRKVYVPRGMAGVQALRTVMLSPFSEFIIGRGARTAVPHMEDEVRALGGPR
ncbi:SDR family oxidoreductase [Micromonospora sp. CPCC 205371]|nr:SDR family oxidoreductase [Micromonospora sp. CPCC 205371]